MVSAVVGVLYGWLIYTVRESATVTGKKESDFAFGPSAISLANGIDDPQKEVALVLLGRCRMGFNRYAEGHSWHRNSPMALGRRSFRALPILLLD
jgi:hypothetical protein